MGTIDSKEDILLGWDERAWVDEISFNEDEEDGFPCDCCGALGAYFFCSGCGYFACPDCWEGFEKDGYLYCSEDCWRETWE